MSNMDLLRKFQTTLIFISLLLSFANSYPSGAPTSQCTSLKPLHGSESYVENYRLVVSKTNIASNAYVNLTIAAVSTDVKFRGFIIQAQEVSGNEPIGTFTFSDSLGKTITCSGDGDTFTHASREDKDAIEVTWRPPPNFEGTIKFAGTVVETRDLFYPNLESDEVQIDGEEDPGTTQEPGTGTEPTEDTTTPTASSSTEEPPASSFYSTCGVSKSCFGSPGTCLNSKNCQFAVSVVKIGDKYRFELVTFQNEAAYVAVALSDKPVMNPTSVMECVKFNQNINKYDSWMSVDPRGDQTTSTLLSSTSLERGFSCLIERNAVTTVNEVKFDLDNVAYHLLLATGSDAYETGVGEHNLGFDMSSKQLLGELGDFGRVSRLMFKLHGIFMIIAWIGTTSVGIISARFFKDQFSSKKAFNKDIWFVLHVFNMVTTFILTMTAFTLIFIKVGGWSATKNPHPILGLITTILCFLQPIGAFFRPHPKDPNRKYFNIVHFSGGNLAHFFAILTLFYAVSLSKAELPNSTYWVLGAFAVYYISVHVILTITTFNRSRFSKSAYEIGKQIILAFHVLTVIGFVIGLCYIVGASPFSS